MITRPLAVVTIALLLTPLITVAAGVPVETDFAKFSLPTGWSSVSTQARNVRKPTIYLRQKYKVTAVGSATATVYLYMQDIPSFRGPELPLSEIDAAFDRVSQLSADGQTLSDHFIPNLTELHTSTGTLLGRPSREFSFWTEPTDTKYFYRLAYASFGGKLYGVEMGTVLDTPEHAEEWKTLVTSLRGNASSSSTSVSSKLSSASSRSVRDTKSSSSVTTSSSRSSESSSSRATVDRSPRGERVKIRLQKRLRKVTAFTQELANGAF